MVKKVNVKAAETEVEEQETGAEPEEETTEEEAAPKKLVKKEKAAPKAEKVKKETKAPKEEDPNQVTLKQLCDEHKLNATTARVKLRRKFGAKGLRYSWEKDSEELEAIVELLTKKEEPKAEKAPKAKKEAPAKKTTSSKKKQVAKPEEEVDEEEDPEGVEIE
jgi:hypothetical protein